MVLVYDIGSIRLGGHSSIVCACMCVCILPMRVVARKARSVGCCLLSTRTLVLERHQGGWRCWCVECVTRLIIHLM